VLPTEFCRKGDSMKGQIRPVFFAVFIATLFLSAPAAQAIQCSAAPSSSQQGYWFWRQIDGRKCWYVGKTMISKSLLPWPAATPAKTASNAPTPARVTETPARVTETPARVAEKPARVTEKHGAPLNAQARMPDDTDSFESRWRARVIDE
jgi:hypothetical protein